MPLTGFKHRLSLSPGMLAIKIEVGDNIGGLQLVVTHNLFIKLTSNLFGIVGCNDQRLAKNKINVTIKALNTQANTSKIFMLRFCISLLLTEHTNFFGFDGVARIKLIRNAHRHNT